MRYLTKIFLVCLLAFTVVLAMDLSRSGNDSIVRRTWGSSEATEELQSDEVMTKSFPPMLKVELDDVFRKRILEHIQKKASSFPGRKWSRLHPYRTGAETSDAHGLINALYVSTPIPIWAFPNIWAEDESFLYVWYSEEPWGYCIDKDKLVYETWSLDAPATFYSDQKPVLNKFSHLKSEL